MLKNKLLIFAVCGLLFGILSASLALADSKIVSVTIDNPDEALKEVVLKFYIPYNLTPINLQEDIIWNEIARELSINVGDFEAKESRVANFTLDGPFGTYLVTGRLSGKWQSDGENFEGDVDPFTITIGTAVLVADGVGINFEEIAQGIAVPVSIVLGAVTVGSLAANAFSASGYLASELANFLSYIGLGLFLSKKRKPWGKVYNAVTTKPIYGAIVRLLDTEFKKIKETQMTDREGRFGFLVAPGQYYIKVSYHGFHEKQTEPITISDPNQTIALDVPIVSLQSNIGLSAFKFAKLKQSLRRVFNAISAILLIVGTLLSLLAFVIVTTLLNFIILAVYFFLWLFRIILRKRHTRSFGRALESESNVPLSLAVIRLFSADSSWLLATHVTDDLGRFNFLIESGSYYITAVHDGYQPFQSLPVEFTKANVLAMDVKMEKGS